MMMLMLLLMITVIAIVLMMKIMNTDNAWSWCEYVSWTIKIRILVLNSSKILTRAIRYYAIPVSIRYGSLIPTTASCWWCMIRIIDTIAIMTGFIPVDDVNILPLWAAIMVWPLLLEAMPHQYPAVPVWKKLVPPSGSDDYKEWWEWR